MKYFKVFTKVLEHWFTYTCVSGVTFMIRMFKYRKIKVILKKKFNTKIVYDKDQ